MESREVAARSWRRREGGEGDALSRGYKASGGLEEYVLMIYALSGNQLLAMDCIF